MCHIEFHCPDPGTGEYPPPYPAARAVPKWFKDMDADHEHGGTLKRCAPFLTAMTAGYIIPSPTEAKVSVSPTGALSVSGAGDMFSAHFPAQYKGAPFESRSVVKFNNPWVIVTPPEYVCLISAPINRFETPFIPLTGIVETGAYYRHVQLPMISMIAPGQSFTLRRGTPIIQVIPMKRDEWTSSTRTLNVEQYEGQHAMLAENPHAYKDHWWRKIQFS